MAAARLSSLSGAPSPSHIAFEPASAALLLLESRATYDLPEVCAKAAAPDQSVIQFPPALDLVELYFDDAIRNGKSSLLTHREEIELAKAIEAGRHAAAKLSAKRVSTNRGRSLNQLIQHGDRARDQLITANLRLVVSVATRYRNSAMPLADLIQEGNIGLMQAVDRFDWRRGTRFSTYAVWWIRQAIARSLANSSRLIRIPVHAHQRLAMIARSTRDLYQTLGHSPTPGEIAESTGLSEDLVRDLLIYLHPPSSLEAPIETANGAATFLEALAQDPDIRSIEDQAGLTLAQEALGHALQSLAPRERQLLSCRHGLGGREQLSLRAAAESLGVSKGQAQGIEASALAKLRRRQDAFHT